MTPRHFKTKRFLRCIFSRSSKIPVGMTPSLLIEILMRLPWPYYYLSAGAKLSVIPGIEKLGFGHTHGGIESFIDGSA